MSRNLRLTLAYDGTDFSGWQVQPDAPTIQGALASAVGRLTGENVLPQGSGRTDAGVHALAQVASFATESPIPTENFLKALNAILPMAIRVLEVREVPAEFHARRSALAKTYRYRIFREPVCSPFLVRYVWHFPYPLDEEGMAQAAGEVIGEHDFTSFAAVDPEREEPNPSNHQGRPSASLSAGSGVPKETQTFASNVRRIFSSSWERQGDEFIYTVHGSGFLHHMVRNLVGTFILVGKGTLKVADIVRILEACNRTAAGATAPARGLFLVSVEY